MVDDIVAELSCDFDAPPETVFEAWTSPAVLPLWLAPPPYRMVEAAVDARPGGAYVHHVSGPDGEHVVRGTFADFVQDRHLRFSWNYAGPNPVPRPETTWVEVRFDRGANGGTVLRLTHAGLRDEREFDHYQIGWGVNFNQLSEVLER